jgi:L-fuconolactonase
MIRVDAHHHVAFMLDVAQKSAGLVRGVVGWTDFAHRNVPARIAALASEPLLKGLRPMLQDIPDTDWILHAEIQPTLVALTATGLRFDALVQPRHLPCCCNCTIFIRRCAQ